MTIIVGWSYFSQKHCIYFIIIIIIIIGFVSLFYWVENNNIQYGGKFQVHTNAGLHEQSLTT